MKLYENKKSKSYYAFKRYLYGIFQIAINKLSYAYFGTGSVIYRPHKIIGKKHIYIGKNVTFDKDLRMEAICQNKIRNFTPKIYIGSHTHAEQRCQIFSANLVRIGKNVVLSSDVYITDVEHGYSDMEKNVLEQELKIGKTLIGNYTFIGAGVKIIKPVIIGEHVIIGANSVITKDIPAYSVVAGIPAKIIKSYNFEKQCWEKT